MRDFCERVRPDGAEALNLIRTGAFDDLGGTRTEQFWHCLRAGRADSAEGDWLFRDASEQEVHAAFRAEPSVEQMLADESELLGFTISGHPLDRWPEIVWQTYCPVAKLSHYHNQSVTICGLIVVTRSHLQANGEPMKFISISDRTGIVECEIFAEAYAAHGLATVRYPVVEVFAHVQPFDNNAGFTLDVLRVGRPRAK